MKNPWPIWVGLVLIGVAAGCDSTRPSSPSKVYSVKISVPSTNELRSSLLTSANNELLYRVDGPGMNPLKGTLGPFASPAATGSIDFTLAIPSGSNRLLSLQLNDASTHQPLAIGAAKLDLSGSGTPVSVVAVDLGSVVRNCYNLNSLVWYGNTYGFNSNQLSYYVFSGTTDDISFNALGSGYQIIDAQGNTGGALNASSIAYLGNGNFVDYDLVPSDAAFYPQSNASKAAAGAAVTILEKDDIYCVKLGSIPGGHAWVQVKSAGVSGVSGPSINFRVNDSKPYFAYYQTPPDASGTPCPAQ